MKTIKNLKTAAYEYCSLYVSQRANRIHTQIKELENALKTETKSSAGDKHETGRAMIQLEREKLGQQLAEVEKMQHLLQKVPLENTADTIGLGNLVVTDTHSYYLAISAGNFKTQHQSVFCISIATPMGKLLVGKTIGDLITFRNKSMKVLHIY